MLATHQNEADHRAKATLRRKVDRLEGANQVNNVSHLKRAHQLMTARQACEENQFKEASHFVK